jgi:hypothetical protein
MIALVCGGRTYDDSVTLAHVLDEYPTISKIVHGGAKGADERAGNYARRRGINLEVFHADWKTNGKAAGPIRNSQMLNTAKPDIVFAFPGGKGTSDLVSKARRLGIRVIEVPTEGG